MRPANEPWLWDPDGRSDAGVLGASIICKCKEFNRKQAWGCLHPVATGHPPPHVLLLRSRFSQCTGFVLDSNKAMKTLMRAIYFYLDSALLCRMATVAIYSLLVINKSGHLYSTKGLWVGLENGHQRQSTICKPLAFDACYLASVVPYHWL
ncbi:uncharacterized protein [Lolium perenne]|uniref:uncharacterized protein n=1 Tax=Lolium perenne TaxID=4522 RepID=UPI0021F52F02|nr:uncharacterized protein LOC127343437 [Lolium perenne]